MDPNTNTRKEFTTDLISNPIPGKADPEWKTNVERQKVLMEKLTHRPAMAPNLNQTYMMLANSKNKVYFEWDFVGRTFGMLYGVNPTLQNLSKAEKEKWHDAVGRAILTRLLITDDKPGMLNMMTELTYPE